MKILTIIAVTLILASCSKESTDSARIAAVSDPAASVTFAPAYAGGSVSIKFSVSVTVPSPGSVKSINLYRFPTMLMQTINAPESKVYTMYDHLVDVFPTYAQNAFYQIQFIMTDGERIMLEPFQVY